MTACGATGQKPLSYNSLAMAEQVCPYWVGYLLISPLRRWVHDPARLLERYVQEGMTVLEPGPGMGFFTLEMARRVGPSGRVIAVDLQPKMLERLKSRAATAGLLGRIDLRLSSGVSLGLRDLRDKVDFTLAFAVVHELPDEGSFFREVAEVSKSGARLLVAEPRWHVRKANFDAEEAFAAQAGFQVLERPSIRGSHSTLFQKE